MNTRRQKSAHTPIMAAGGIVVTAGRSPLVALVQRRKDGGWILPRGKQKSRESAIAAAQREVEKETGHNVVVQDFLGTISCESKSRPKIIQFWLMISVGPAGQELMDDNKAVKWLPLNAAVASLTEPLEQAFLAHIGQRSLAETRAGSRRDKSRLPHGTKSRNRTSVAPNFIRRFFRRFKNPRHTSIQSAGWLG